MIEQIAISIFGITAAWLSMDLRLSYRKYACILGILGQPFWFYSSYNASQWGIFLLCFFYSASWIRGFNNYWIIGVNPDTDVSELKSKLSKANQYNTLLEEKLKDSELKFIQKAFGGGEDGTSLSVVSGVLTTTSFRSGCDKIYFKNVSS